MRREISYTFLHSFMHGKHLYSQHSYLTYLGTSSSRNHEVRFSKHHALTDLVHRPTAVNAMGTTPRAAALGLG